MSKSDNHTSPLGCIFFLLFVFYPFSIILGLNNGIFHHSSEYEDPCEPKYDIPLKVIFFTYDPARLLGRWLVGKKVC